MAGATFGRVHTWATDEVIKTADLNAEFNNILNNLDPSGLGGWSDTVGEMQLQTSPGGLGSESLATSLSGELQRLRYVIAQIIGTQVQFWYQPPNISLTTLVGAIGSGLPQNRIISGITTGKSSQLHALLPQGSASFVLTASSVSPFQYSIQQISYSITASVTVAGLALAPTSGNTALISPPPYSGTVATASAVSPNPLGQQWTNVLGMFNSTISVSAMGASIVSLIGKMATFQDIVSGEYFLASVATSASLVKAWRGCFFGTTSAVNPSSMTTGDTIQLMQTAWVYANSTLSVNIATTNPTISTIQPASPANGDYWFNLNTTTWMTFTSTQWINASATLVGIAVLNTVGCVAARTLNAYVAPSAVNTLRMSVVPNSTSQVITQNIFSQVAINGQLNSFQESTPVWDFTTNMQSGFSVSPGQVYLYMTENGSPVMSPISPLQRSDLLGLYHPQETWRALGSVNVNSSTALEAPVKNFVDTSVENLQIGGWQPYFGSGGNNPVLTASLVAFSINSSPGTATGTYTNGNQSWTAQNTIAGVGILTCSGNVLNSTPSGATGSLISISGASPGTVPFSSYQTLSTISFVTAYSTQMLPTQSNRFIQAFSNATTAYVGGGVASGFQSMLAIQIPPGTWKISGVIGSGGTLISGVANQVTGSISVVAICNTASVSGTPSQTTVLPAVYVGGTAGSSAYLPPAIINVQTTQYFYLGILPQANGTAAGNATVSFVLMLAERIDNLIGGL